MENSFYASDIHWGPGQWPLDHIFNGRVYFRAKRLTKDNDLVGYTYLSAAGDEITVWND